MRKRLLATLMAVASSSMAFAQTAAGPQFQVNSYTTSYQSLPAIGQDADGTFVVVWGSLGSDTGDADSWSIQGQRFSANGDALGTEFLVNSYATSIQREPALARGANGEFVIAWQSLGSDGNDASSFSVQGQRFASDGSSLGAEFQVNSYTTDAQGEPALAAATNGDFVAVWSSDGSDGNDSSYLSVQGQRFSSEGFALGPQFQINSYTPDLQWSPALTSSPNGDFVVVWHSYGSNGDDDSNTSIQGQRYSSDGSNLGSEFQVNSYTSDRQRYGSVAAGPSGDFVVVWNSLGSDNGDDSSYSVQGKRFSSAGASFGEQFLVNSYTIGSQVQPRIAVDTIGDFVVVWHSKYSDDGDTAWSVQGRRFASDGSPLGDQFLVNSYTTGNQVFPAVAAGPDGEFVVVWHSYGSDTGDTSQTSVQGQRFRVCRLFCDGFESGDTSAWGATTP